MSSRCGTICLTLNPNTKVGVMYSIRCNPEVIYSPQPINKQMKQKQMKLAIKLRLQNSSKEVKNAI